MNIEDVEARCNLTFNQIQRLECHPVFAVTKTRWQTYGQLRKILFSFPQLFLVVFLASKNKSLFQTADFLIDYFHSCFSIDNYIYSAFRDLNFNIVHSVLNLIKFPLNNYIHLSNKLFALTSCK